MSKRHFVFLEWLLVFCLGAFGLWHFHRPEFLSRFDLVSGGLGDPCLITAILEYLHRVFSGSGSLTSLPFYFPAPGTLGYSETFLTQFLLYEPLRLFGLDLFSSFQVSVIVINLLNYLCCFLLLRSGFRLGSIPSAFGAFFFAYNAPKFNQMAHAHLQCLFWLPLAVLALVFFYRDLKNLRPWKAFWLLSASAAAFHFQLFTAYYLAWFFLLGGVLFLGAALFSSGVRRFLREAWRRFHLPLLGAAFVFALGLVPFLALHLPVERELGGREFSEVLMMTPKAASFFWMGPRHGGWGGLWEAWPTLRNLPVEGEERMGFGLAVLGAWGILNLWILAWAFRKKFSAKFSKSLAHFGVETGPWFIAAVIAVDLMVLLGTQYGGWTPWKLVYDWVPGAQAIRAVSRYILFLALPTAVLFSFLLHRSFGKIPSGKKAPMGLVMGAALWMGLVVWEQTALPPYPAFSKSAQLARLEHFSTRLPSDCGVFYVTVSPRLPLVPALSATNIQIDAMLLSALRGIPTLNGYSGHTPKGWGLYKVRSPKYGEYVADWVKLNGVAEKVCGIEIDR